MRRDEKEMIQKALSINECLHYIKSCRLLAFVNNKLYNKTIQAHKDYADLIQWYEYYNNRIAAAIKLLETQIKELNDEIADINLIIASKNHDLESTKRELEELRNKYET